MINISGTNWSSDSSFGPDQDDGEGPNLRRLFLLIRRHLSLLILSGLAGLGLSLLISAVASPNYSARATLLLMREGSGEELPDGIIQNEVEVIRSREFMADVLSRLGGAAGLPGAPNDTEGALAFLQDTTNVQRVETSYILAAGAVSSAPEVAARIADEMVDAYIDHRQSRTTDRLSALDTRASELLASINARQTELLEVSRGAGSLDETMLARARVQDLLDSDRVAYAEVMNQRRSADVQDLQAHRLDAATTPLTAAGLPRFMIVALGIFLGLSAGGAIALARDNLDDSLRTGGDVRRRLGKPFLGYLPRWPAGTFQTDDPESPGWRFALSSPLGSYAETLRFVRAAAETRTPRGGYAIGVSAAQAGGGASSVAANLARLLAAEGARVTLIDANIRNARLTRVFGQAGSPLDGGLARSLSTNLTFLPLDGAEQGSQSLYFNATSFLQGFERWRGDSDFLVIDLPTLESAAFCRLLLARLDGWIAVALWGRTRSQTARRILAEQPDSANFLGIVLNAVDRRRLGMYTRDLGSVRDD